MSPKKWIEANPTYAAKGLNLRDTATINQLVVMANLESMNAELIQQGMDKRDRLAVLSRMEKEQLESLDKHRVEQRFQKLIEEANQPKGIKYRKHL